MVKKILSSYDVAKVLLYILISTYVVVFISFSMLNERMKNVVCIYGWRVGSCYVYKKDKSRLIYIINKSVQNRELYFRAYSGIAFVVENASMNDIKITDFDELNTCPRLIVTLSDGTDV